MAVKGVSRPAPRCAQFGGFYVGGHAGWTYHDTTWVDRDAWVDNFSFDWALGSVNRTNDGISAGVQAGYNWQFGCTVFGVEIDGSWADLDNTRVHSPTAGPGTVLTLNSKVEWYGTARTRTGVVVDNLLLYVTGGFAYADIKKSWRIDDPNVGLVLPHTEAFSASRERWGWVAGVGTEWAFTPNLSIKSEALYVRFSEVSTTVFSPNGAQNVSFDNQDSMWIARIGLNYRFGGNPL